MWYDHAVGGATAPAATSGSAALPPKAAESGSADSTQHANATEFSAGLADAAQPKGETIALDAERSGQTVLTTPLPKGDGRAESATGRWAGQEVSARLSAVHSLRGGRDQAGRRATMEGEPWEHLEVMVEGPWQGSCLLYTSPSPRDAHESRMPSSA